MLYNSTFKECFQYYFTHGDFDSKNTKTVFDWKYIPVNLDWNEKVSKYRRLFKSRFRKKNFMLYSLSE